MNTQFFDMMLGMRGIEYSNPTMTYDEAVGHLKGLEERLSSLNQPGIEEDQSEYFLA